MSNMNIFAATGNLVDDPRLMGEEQNVVRFTIAINNGFGDRRTTTFVDCVGFGKQSATIANNFRKGNQIGIRGSLVQNSWQDDEGNKRSKIEVKLENYEGFFFVGNRTVAGASDDGGDDEAEPVVAGGEGGEKLF